MSPRQRTVAVRIPAGVAERLEREAEARGVAPGWMAGRLLDEALGNLAPAEEFSLTRRKAKLPPVDPERLPPIRPDIHERIK